MWLVNLLKAFLETWTSANRVAEKALPSEKIQEEKFEIKKETLTAKEEIERAELRNKIADEMFHDLKNHPELDVADKVNFELLNMGEDEKKLLIKIITDRLTEWRKKKKSKFRI